MEIRHDITEEAYKNFGHYKVSNSCNNSEGLNNILLALNDPDVIREINRYVKENIK